MLAFLLEKITQVIIKMVGDEVQLLIEQSLQLHFRRLDL